MPRSSPGCFEVTRRLSRSSSTACSRASTALLSHGWTSGGRVRGVAQRRSARRCDGWIPGAARAACSLDQAVAGPMMTRAMMTPCARSSIARGSARGARWHLQARLEVAARRDGGAASLALGEDGRPPLRSGFGIAWQAQTPGHETMQQGHQDHDLTGPEAIGAAQRTLAPGRIRRRVSHQPHHDGPSRSLSAHVRSFTPAAPGEPEPVRASAGPLRDPAGHAAGRRSARGYRPTIHPESTATGRGAGVELLLQRTHGRVFGWVSYVISKSERQLYGHTVPFDFDRRHGAAIAVNVQVASRVRVSATSQDASGFPIAPLQPEVRFAEFPNQSSGLLKPLRDGDGDLIEGTLSRQPRAAGARQAHRAFPPMPAPTCASPWPSRNGSRRTAKS